jgi:hypothetical protein
MISALTQIKMLKAKLMNQLHARSISTGNQFPNPIIVIGFTTFMIGTFVAFIASNIHC